MTKQMKAMVINQFGAPSVFHEAQVPQPEVVSGHVLIRVAASSVNPLDFKIRNGLGAPLAPAFPAVLHGDVAGVIEEVGAGVSQFKPGDEVYGCAGGIKGTDLGGALADFMLADADLIALKPKSLTMAEAAALPQVVITAWDGLIDRTRVHAGQTVLVHAATGGVGHIGIQLAKWAGAKVFATGSSEEKLKIARDLGADVAINYRTQSVAEYVAKYTDGRGFDVVFDTVGGGNVAKSIEATALNGTVVTIDPGGTYDLTPLHAKGLTLHMVYILIPLLHGIGRAVHGNMLSQLTKLVDEGKIHPLLDAQQFTFADVAAAHQYAEAGRTIGKVTLVH